MAIGGGPSALGSPARRPHCRIRNKRGAGPCVRGPRGGAVCGRGSVAGGGPGRGPCCRACAVWPWKCGRVGPSLCPPVEGWAGRTRGRGPCCGPGGGVACPGPGRTGGRGSKWQAIPGAPPPCAGVDRLVRILQSHSSLAASRRFLVLLRLLPQLVTTRHHAPRKRCGPGVWVNRPAP